MPLHPPHNRSIEDSKKMTSLKLSDNKLHYISDKIIGKSRQEPDWILDINEIKAIGINRIMDFDDDSFFIVFIDLNNSIYIINNTWNDKHAEVEKLITKMFDIPFKWEKIIDKNEIIYPEKLRGKPIFKKWTNDLKSLLFELKRQFRINTHISSGMLTDELRQYK